MYNGIVRWTGFKRGYAVGLVAIALLAVSACKKEEPAPAPGNAGQHAGQPGQGHADMPMGAGHGPAMPQPKTTKQVVVSDEIKQKYTKVDVVVTNKATGKANTYSVTPNSEFAVPDTELKLEVGAFIPDFSMGENQIISKSTDLNNPGLQVKIFDGAAQKYEGWLFANFPDMHPFEHEKYSVTLAKLSK